MFVTNNKDFKKYKKEQVFNLDIPLYMNAKLIQIRHDSCKTRSVYSNWKVRQVEKDLQMVIEFEKDKFLV